MIAAGVVIAVYLPEIGLSLLAGVGFGALFAAALIVFRSRSTATRPDGNSGLPPSVLALNDDSARGRTPGRRTPGDRRTAAIA